MNAKLEEWLATLPEADRVKVVELLGDLAGDLAVETPEDRIIAEARRAAGLPPEPPSVDPIRKAAGLK
jgi:hypothetical protein